MKIKKGSLSEIILLGLEKAVDGYVRFEDFATHTYIYARGYERDLNKSDLAQALRRLRNKGYIEKNTSDQKEVTLRLTELGRDLIETQTWDEKDWDGRWRIVIFDIPEQKRAVRRILRERLKIWRFKMWQKSVWIGKRDITRKFKRLVEDLSLEQWVAIIESTDSSLGLIQASDRT